MSQETKTKPKKENMASHKTAKRGANKARTENKPNINLESMGFWRDLAKQVCPDLDDEYEIGEVALMLQETCKHISNEQERISKICNKNADTKITVGLQFTIDRRTVPSEVSSKIGYAEKYSSTIKSQVPDPNQDELPGITKTQATGDAEGVQEDEPKEEGQK